MSAVTESTQDERDVALEKRIEQARIAMTEAETPQARRDWHEEFRWLHSQRSEQQIKKMEKERGLAT